MQPGRARADGGCPPSGPITPERPRLRLVLAAPERELLLRAVALAREARASGNHPFRAVVAGAEGGVLVEAQNSVVTGIDRTGHAELNAVRALGARPADELAAATLFPSTVPCAMCAGFWTG